MTMIGVLAEPSETDVVQEFFELFKTPWEFCRPDQSYEVVLCASKREFEGTARLILRYAGQRTRFDEGWNVERELPNSVSRMLVYRGQRIPIYGDVIAFPEQESLWLTDEDSRESAAYVSQLGESQIVRLGYDLFGEIRELLTHGQPMANAGIPTIELHISLLRDLITESGIPLVEIPPVPEGYQFIACLTHDIDHPSLRQHKWDHTAFGFLYRAVFGSLRRLIRNEISVRDVALNWWAAVKLPFVYFGVARDFWCTFDDRYLALERGNRSTFFVIPFKNMPGIHTNGSAPQFRAAKYGAADIADSIQKLVKAGCEVGLHGIDAWCDSTRGRAECDQIRSITGTQEIGVRMHWLYYDQESPSKLEAAGATFDSSIGYNEAVGYRAGTTQAYKPFGSTRLLELPLHVMDTALFYPSHLGLSPQRAKEMVDHIIENATKFGGCITVNWHDRSVAPERMWEAPYRELIGDVQRRGAWFATAGEAVSWFRQRRAATFAPNEQGDRETRWTMIADRGMGLPRLQLRTSQGKPRAVAPDRAESRESIFVRSVS